MVIDEAKLSVTHTEFDTSYTENEDVSQSVLRLSPSEFLAVYGASISSHAIVFINSDNSFDWTVCDLCDGMNIYSSGSLNLESFN